MLELYGAWMPRAVFWFFEPILEAVPELSEGGLAVAAHPHLAASAIPRARASPVTEVVMVYYEADRVEVEFHTL